MHFERDNHRRLGCHRGLMMERDRLICCLVGKYSALDKTINADYLRIKIDQHLSEVNMIPLGQEDGDVELMQDLLDETIFSVLSAGINRKTRRSKQYS